MSYNAAAYVFDGGINFGSAETLDLFTISLLFLCNRRNEAHIRSAASRTAATRLKSFGMMTISGRARISNTLIGNKSAQNKCHAPKNTL